MTEQRAMERFETRFGARVRGYADVATARQIDALGVARTAMSSQRAGGRSWSGLGTGLLGRRNVDARWAVALMAVLLVGVVSVGILGRPAISSAPSLTASPSSPTASSPGPIPDALRHSWQRPTPVAPGPDVSGGSGILRLGSGQLAFWSDAAAAASISAVTATGIDTLAVTATVDTIGCAVGDVGAYRYLVEGRGTVLTLTAVGPDACAAREEALTGPWVRSDLPVTPEGAAPLPPGTHETSLFDPFGDPAAPTRLSYTIPEGWNLVEDAAFTFVLLRHDPDAPLSQPPADLIVALLAQPRMAADFVAGRACGPVSEAPGAGHSLDDLVASIVARPGVASTPPVAVTIGGHEGQLLDLQMAPSWTGTCLAPDGPIVGVPVLVGGSTQGPLVGLGPDHPVRLILLDLGEGRTMAIVFFDLGTADPARFQAHVAAAMPVVESFEFQSPKP